MADVGQLANQSAEIGWVSTAGHKGDGNITEFHIGGDTAGHIADCAAKPGGVGLGGDGDVGNFQGVL